jgi:hypothetical protein
MEEKSRGEIWKKKIYKLESAAGGRRGRSLKLTYLLQVAEALKNRQHSFQALAKLLLLLLLMSPCT